MVGALNDNAKLTIGAVVNFKSIGDYVFPHFFITVMFIIHKALARPVKKTKLTVLIMFLCRLIPAVVNNFTHC